MHLLRLIRSLSSTPSSPESPRCPPPVFECLQMKELAIYLLLVQGGNAAPSAADVKTAAEAVGITVDDASVEQVIANVAGKVRVFDSGLDAALL